MRSLLIYLIIALILSLVAYLGIGSDAYVLIRAGETALQMTIWIAIILAALILILFKLCWVVINGAFFGGWRKAWLQHRQERLTAAAIKTYTDQNWPKAYKQLVKLANSHEDPQPYVMMAAQAAVASGNVERGRDTYLQALDQFPQNSFQVRLRLAYLELSIGNRDRAEQLCKQLLLEQKRDPDTKLLQILIAEDRGDWQQMQELLAVARTHKVLAARLPTIEHRFLRAYLTEGPTAPELIKLATLMADSRRVPAELAISLAQQLAMKGQADRAEQFMRKRIVTVWDSDLVAAYANIEGKSAKAQLKVAESWLVDHSDDKALLQCLHKLSLRLNDVAKTNDYQQKLLSI